MLTADFDHTIFTAQQREQDKSLLVKFFTKAVKDEAQSNTEGRPVFRDKTYIEIRMPGNRSDVVSRPATQRDIDRFPDHHEAFQKRTEDPMEGTPLAEWPQITRTQVEELAFFNVKTVEQLAQVSDAHGQSFRGFYALKEKAQKFIEASKTLVEAAQLKDELKQRDDEIGELKQMMKALQAQLTEKGSAVAQENEAIEDVAPLDKPKTRSPRRRSIQKE